MPRLATRLLCLAAVTLFLSPQLIAAEDEPAAKAVKELILPGESFLIEGCPSFILLPPKEKRQKPQPWIMYAPTLPGYPDSHEKRMHQQFLAAGVAVAGIDVGEGYGSPKSQKLMTALYTELTEKRGFAAKPCLLGRSRGGLWVSSWAIANPDKVAGIAGIYPVFDLRTYPGIAKAAPAYGLTTQELEASLSEHNPISRIDVLAKAKLPVCIIHGDDDKVVPLKENSAALADQYKQAGVGDAVKLIVANGQGHNYWEGFFRCQELIDFAIQKAKAGDAEVEVMEKIADLALIPPMLNTSPLPEYGYNKLDYGMTIGIERTPHGRLWACWVAGGDSPKAFFVLATSDDDGEHWSPPRLVVDSHSKDLPRERSILVGNLWTDPLGRLWLIFDQSMDMFDGRAGVWVTICENPDADEPTWSAPRHIWHGVTLNKPTVLTSGEWMLPISLDQRGGFGPFKGCFAELDPMRGANVFVSTDRGKSWQRRGAAVFPSPDWHEHMIVERRDGALWMLARTAKGIMESISTDGGRTWTEPLPSAIKHPVARFHIRRLVSGRLLLVKHGATIDAHEGRSQLTAWLSDDDGNSWHGGLMLDQRKGISYPDGFQAPDGALYISYDRNRATDGEILLARFTEADILAGQLTSPKSKLKMLISRPLGNKHASNPK